MFTVTNRSKGVVFVAGSAINPGDTKTGVPYIDDQLKGAIASGEITVTPNLQFTLGVNRVVNQTGESNPGIIVGGSYNSDAVLAVEVGRLRSDVDNLVATGRAKGTL
jgi:hypothetical protein